MTNQRSGIRSSFRRGSVDAEVDMPTAKARLQLPKDEMATHDVDACCGRCGFVMFGVKLTNWDGPDWDTSDTTPVPGSRNSN